jgi:hypothetical protein
MNADLQKLFTRFYNPTSQAAEPMRGASSIAGTKKIRDELWPLFERHGIRSMFDAGCNDCAWAQAHDPRIIYSGGDISAEIIAEAHRKFPHLNVQVFDVTTDPIPAVDVLFVRDVTIHLCNADKLRMLRNWLDSSVPWLLTTTEPAHQKNIEIKCNVDGFPWAGINWQLPPWNFPEPRDCIVEQGHQSRRLALWHQDQLKDLTWQLRE